MADSLYISPVARWMAENGYVASLLKGSPYSTHAKQPGSRAALCGKRPGEPKPGSTHRNRTGWGVYSDGRACTCKACLAAIEAAIGVATDGGTSNG